MKLKRWGSDDGRTRQWSAELVLGQVRIGYTVYRHTYPRGDRRWVIQPNLVIDVP